MHALGPKPYTTGMVSSPKPRLILVVDDFPDSVDPLVALLHERGCAVSLALDGESALAQAEALKPHAIVLDFAMPRMTGIEALRQLRARPATREIPVVLFSAHAGPELDYTARLAGCSAVFRKPTGTAHVVAHVLDLCAHAELMVGSHG